MRQFILFLICITNLYNPNSNAQILQSVTDTLAPQVFETPIIQAESSPTILMENNTNDNGVIVIDPSQLQLVTHWVDGRVVDNNYQTLRDARVYFKDKKTGDIFRTKTNQNGKYKYQLADGEYDVTVEVYPYKQTRAYSIYIRNNEEHMEDIEMLKKINVTVYLQLADNNHPIRDGELVCYQNGKAYYFQASKNNVGAFELMLFPGKYDFKYKSSRFNIAKADYSQIINRNNQELIFRLTSLRKEFILNFNQLESQNEGFEFIDVKKYKKDAQFIKTKSRPMNMGADDPVIFYEPFYERYKGEIINEKFKSNHSTPWGMALYTAPLNLPNGSRILDFSWKTKSIYGQGALVVKIIRKRKHANKIDQELVQLRGFAGKKTLHTKNIKEAIIDNKNYDYFIDAYISNDIEKWNIVLMKWERDERWEPVYIEEIKLSYLLKS